MASPKGTNAVVDVAAGKAKAPERKRGGGRLIRLDVARGVALAAMAIYHFGWDLEFFGYMAGGTTGTGAWKLFARSIASSFLFLAGFSLVLGHHPEIRWRPFLRRLAMIVAAAAAITLATYFATPDRFIFFGILHAIALSSLAGLLFLRLPPLLTVIVAVAVLAAPYFLRSTFFGLPILWWVGLSPESPPSNDYVPFFPWFAPTLFGIAAARLAKEHGWLALLAAREEPATVTRGLALAGRHSLLVYLLHQPVLIAVVYAFSLAVPAPAADPVASYHRSCVSSCAASQPEAFCNRFCTCTEEELLAQGLFDDLLEGRMDPASDQRAGEIANQCTVRIFEGEGG
jgi:uncharacterized membrane protein